MSIEHEGTGRPGSSHGAGGDVQSSLADMDRKLQDLQRELASVGERPAPASSGIAPQPPAPGVPQSAFQPAPPPVPGVPPPAPIPPPPPAYPRGGVPSELGAAVSPPQPSTPGGARTAVHDLQGVDPRARMAAIEEELLRLRDAIHAMAADYEAAVRQAAPPGWTGYPGAPAPYPPPGPPLGPAQTAGHQIPPGYAPAPLPAPPGPEAQQFEGNVVVEAGPFTDIAALSSFEQALQGLPRIADVYVRGFEGHRALIDVTLTGPTTLVQDMKSALPYGFEVVDVDRGTLSVEVEASGTPPEPPPSG